jgi:4'-phosphopantetheinyl transferase
MDNNPILWPLLSADFALDGDAVHVWAISLQVCGEMFRCLTAMLAAAERRRAELFHFDRDRNRFVVSRGTLRMILGRYLRAPPASIEFEQESHGKPLLAGHWAKIGLHFNLTHCEDLALLAIARDRTVGIDLERIRALNGAQEMAANFCSQRENAELQALPPAEREAAFFRLWTCKEAWLKAIGDGIGTSLQEVEVSLGREAARYMGLPHGMGTTKDWNLFELNPAAGFIAALAVPGQVPKLCCWRWNEQNQS